MIPGRTLRYSASDQNPVRTSYGYKMNSDNRFLLILFLTHSVESEAYGLYNSEFLRSR